MIPVQSLLELRIKRGTHWKRGMQFGAVIGGAIDLALLVAFFIYWRPPSR